MEDESDVSLRREEDRQMLLLRCCDERNSQGGMADGRKCQLKKNRNIILGTMSYYAKLMDNDTARTCFAILVKYVHPYHFSLHKKYFFQSPLTSTSNLDHDHYISPMVWTTLALGRKTPEHIRFKLIKTASYFISFENRKLLIV